MTDRVWFLTGASRGFGIEIAKAALAMGDRVVATARTPETITLASEDLLVLPADVTDEGQLRAAVEAAVARFGRIDVLVNNAGRGLLGAVEEVPDAEARAVFDVNVFGALAATRAVLPVLRRQRSGLIVNITSSGGIMGRPGWGVYCASKFALEGISESLGHEVAPLGIRVIAIEPGGFRTNFLDASSLSTAHEVIDDYAETAGKTREWAEKSNYAQAGDPAKAAAIIVSLPDHAELPERLQLGEDCFTTFGLKLERTAAERAAWKDVSVSTGFEESAEEPRP
jgi:NAD(P)-dependent dehydrogenase (short-subunit alcohol dehydrogenase family)